METEMETMEQLADRIFASVAGYVDAEVVRQISRQIRVMSAQRDAEFLNLLKALELRISGLERQCESHRLHLAGLQKRIKPHE